MATERTRWMASFRVAWAIFLVLPCRVFSLSDHCTVSKILPCDGSHEYLFERGPEFEASLNCLFAFSTDNGCTMAITMRDVKMAPPDKSGECVSDRLQIYDLKDGILVPGNAYCGTGAAKNGTELNEMSSNVGLVVFSSNENETPRSFHIRVTTRRVEAPETGGTGSEGPTTGAPGGSGNSTEPPEGGVGGNGTQTGPPQGGVGGNETGPPEGGAGVNGTETGSPGGGVGGNETRPPESGAGVNGTETGPPEGGAGGDGTETGPPVGGVGRNETGTRPSGGGGVGSNGTLPSTAPRG